MKRGIITNELIITVRSTKTSCEYNTVIECIFFISDSLTTVLKLIQYFHVSIIIITVAWHLIFTVLQMAHISAF